MLPELRALAVSQGGVFSAQQAIAAGMTRRQIFRHVHTGRWHQLRRGVYCEAEPWSRGDRRAQLLLGAAAALLATHPGTVISHFTAGRLHQLPFLGAWDSRCWLTTPSGPGITPYVRRDLVVEAAGLPPEHITLGNGLPTTTRPRTVVDLARHLPLIEGVVVIDGALFLGATTPAEMEAVLNSCKGWPWVQKAAEAVRLADGRAESPYETVARLLLWSAGIAAQPQVWLHDDLGVVGRVDLYIESAFTVVEVDGDVKYREPADSWTLLREKRRQERMERDGFGVVRVSPYELAERDQEFVVRVKDTCERTSAIRAATAHRLSGRVGPPPPRFSSPAMANLGLTH